MSKRVLMILAAACPPWVHAQPISVGTPVHVSASRPSHSHREVMLCADPTRPGRLLVGSNYAAKEEDRPKREAWFPNVVYYASQNDGANWSLSLDIRNALDPSCTYGPDGAVYAGVMKYPREQVYYNFAVYRSDDAGFTWAEPTIFGNGRALDRPWMSVDHSTSPNHGRVYISAMDNTPLWQAWDIRVAEVDSTKWPSRNVPDPFMVFSSMDRGGTFEQSSNIYLPRPVHPGQNAVLSDGTIVTTVGVVQWAGVYAMTSRDGGRTLSQPVRVGRGSLGDIVRSHLIPTVSVDRSDSPFRDRIYVGWVDATGGRERVVYAFSDDRGATWSRARPIEDPGPFDVANPAKGPVNIHPAIAVNRDGVVGFFWYDRRDHPTKGFTPRFTASLDGGETWLPSVAAGPSTTDDGWGSRAPHLKDWNGNLPEKQRPLTLSYQFDDQIAYPLSQHGDHSGLISSTDGGFHPVWVSDRTGVPQVWTSTLRVRGGIVERNDVTDDLWLVFGRHHYDSTTATATVDVALRNTSAKPLQGPFVMDVLDQDRGQWPQPPDVHRAIVNADNGWLSSGATWAFRVSRADGILQPNEVTQTRRLIFRHRQGADARGITVPHFTFRVLALKRPDPGH